MGRMTLQFVDVATARAARGVRMVVASVVPSPWSEAAKGLFHVQGVAVLAVRSVRDDPEVPVFARAHNVPSVMFDDEPPRTIWSEIVMLAERLGVPGALVPTASAARVRMMGLIHELAGEDGVGWCARLLMIDASLRTGGARGFPLPVARYLASKYGHSEERAAAARPRMITALWAISEALGDGPYFGGEAPNALDVYSATFLTPLCPIPEEDCPQMIPGLRAAFATAHEAMGGELPPALVEHRRRMFAGPVGVADRAVIRAARAAVAAAGAGTRRRR